MNARKRQLDPMSAWLSSSDDEAAAEADIIRAINSSPFELGEIPSSYESDVNGRANSASSCGSAFYECPEATWSGPRRRGRKAYSRVTPAANTPSTKPSGSPASIGSHRNLSDDLFNEFDLEPLLTQEDASTSSKAQPTCKFQCTFCGKELSEKSWKRHEESQHLQRRKWVCMRASVPITDPSVPCIFCVAGSETQFFGCTHRAVECAARPVEERSFARRDHLTQHIKLFHNTSVDDYVLSKWEVEIPCFERTWKCGFCGLFLLGWNRRAAHIATHFRKGDGYVDVGLLSTDGA